MDRQNRSAQSLPAPISNAAYPEGNGVTHVNILRTLEAMYGLKRAGGQQPNADKGRYQRRLHHHGRVREGGLDIRHKWLFPRFYSCIHFDEATDYGGRIQVMGDNDAALFTLKLHRGDGMALVAMNWKNGKPPDDLVGFAIEYGEPGGDQVLRSEEPIDLPWAGRRFNRIGFRPNFRRSKVSLGPFSACGAGGRVPLSRHADVRERRLGELSEGVAQGRPSS